jgi:hypothetical protein
MKRLEGLEKHISKHSQLWRDMNTTRTPDTYVIQRNSFGDGPAGVIATVGLGLCADYY